MVCAKIKNKAHIRTVNPTNCNTFYSWGEKQHSAFFLLYNTSNSDRQILPLSFFETV